MQRKSWQLPAKISNLVSSLTLSLCFQPTSNWDSFWWGFRLSGPYLLFSCFLKKWLRLSSAVDSFSGLPRFSPYTLLKFLRKPSMLTCLVSFYLLLELSCCYKNTLLCFFIKKLELIMYFSQKLLVTKCLKILGSLLSRLQTQHWFIPWVRCTFNDWFIHRPLLYDLTNKQAKKKKQLLKMIKYKAWTENVWKTMWKEKLWETFRKPAELFEQEFLIERK